MIRLEGVRQNNLKGFNLEIPLGKLVVVTGLSGSGKSSLAFETLYAEGQRRYIETFTPYARQFFDRMDRPAVDRIENIPPAIAIEQRNAVRSSRSTIGTMTEICDHLKVLWPHWARRQCRGCGRTVRREPPDLVWETAGTMNGEGAELIVSFDLPLTERLPIPEQLALLGQQGFRRLLIDGGVVRLEDAAGRVSSACRSITVVTDRVRIAAANRSRFIDACEQAYRYGQGRLKLHGPGEEGRRSCQPFSEGLHCAACDIAYPEPTPSLFSFNNPIGACPACKGFGRVISIDPDLALPDRSKTLAEGVVKPWQSGMSAECQKDMIRAARRCGIPLHVPFNSLSEAHRQWVVSGEPGYDANDPEHSWPNLWYGVEGYFRWLESKSYKMHVRVLLSRYRSYRTCADCDGRRFNPESLSFRIPSDGPGKPALDLASFYALPVREALAWVRRFEDPSAPVTDPRAIALREVRIRLEYLEEVGLGYLTLDRPTRTLSGGETERVNLTTCLGSRLTHALFVLDEPSVGLHPRDTDRLIRILHRLRDAGNTVVVVEHEPSVIRAADEVIDIGPGHGHSGGEIVFQGPPKALTQARHSLTAAHLTGRQPMPTPRRRPVDDGSTGAGPGSRTLEETRGDYRVPPPPRTAAGHPGGITSWRENPGTGAVLRLEGARAHNLRDLSVGIPLNRFVCLSGVSGSGKTTLVREILFPLLQQRLAGKQGTASDALDEEVDGESRDEARSALAGASLTGTGSLDAVVLVDQSPIGRTPRSNPAVYIGAFDDIRDLFAASPAARERGHSAGAFSFNSAQGHCERCRGAGFEKIEMQFLSDVFVRCPACQGRRYRDHILEVRLQRTRPAATAEGLDSMSIADLLEEPVEKVLEFLGSLPASKASTRAMARLSVLCEVGLGYLPLGQPVNTLSGGESQRLKLARHLLESSTTLSAHTLFLFDEPTTGLHMEDVRILLGTFQRLVDRGHTVVVIEHNLDVIRAADWIVDLGPEAGDQGGRVVVEGTPEQVARCAASHTGRFLRSLGI
ncbi:MAG: excinuclease ABC subunit UvrA [Verrucomicrobia bacterium]|nr:excinuclease ABC subunit UvrA [Verrucomicrobiota bacterium]